MMNYWINFAYYLDPNGNMTGNPHVQTTNDTVTYGNGNWATHSVKKRKRVCGKESSPVNSTVWLPHGFPENKNSIVFAPGNFSLIQDDFREEQMKVFDGPEMAKDFNFRRDQI